MATLRVSYGATERSPLTSSRDLSSSVSLPLSSKNIVSVSTSTFPRNINTAPFQWAIYKVPFHTQLWPSSCRYRARRVSGTMATGSLQETLPPAFDSTSDPPRVFDGTTRLYISYTCPYAQRVWITRNCKGLQDKIKLVPIDLKNRPAWYKEKVYPANKVPSLEHNNEVKGESLDLIRYIDSHFEGPSLYPDDPAKKEFAEELLAYTDSFYKSVTSSFKGNGDEAGAAFDYIETALSKFSDGPFFLGELSLVDIAYVPFIERFQPFLLDVKKCDITSGRPRLAAWIWEMNKIEGYKQTRRDPGEYVESYKKRFLAHL